MDFEPKVTKIFVQTLFKKEIDKGMKTFFKFSIFLKLLTIEVRKSVYVQGFWRNLNVLLNKIKVTWAKLIYSFHSILQLVYNWSYLAYLYTFRLQLKFSLYLKLLLVLFGAFPISPHFPKLKNYILVILILIEIIWLIDIRNLPNECGWNKQIKSESFRFKHLTIANLPLFWKFLVLGLIISM